MNIVYAQNSSTLQKRVKSKTFSISDSSSQNESLQRNADLTNNAAQRAEAPRPNNTGMPDNLKSGIESLSGFSMDDVRVHYNSSKPATVQALAYTQGTDIHVAPGQEKCLPHEAWHVAQQMAGRVSPTTNINGMPVNDNAALEHEADVMGEKAVQLKSIPQEKRKKIFPKNEFTSQLRPDPDGRFEGYENEQNGITFNRDHIIPYLLIKKFFEKYKSNLISRGWIYGAKSVFDANKKKPGNEGNRDSKFFGVKGDDEKLNAVCWMPSNVFLAPQPKDGDSHEGDDFDITFASAKGVTAADVLLYAETFNYMKECLAGNESHIMAVFGNLVKITQKNGSEIWGFDPKNWLYNPETEMVYAKEKVNLASSSKYIATYDGELKEFPTSNEGNKKDWSKNYYSENSKKYKTGLSLKKDADDLIKKLNAKNYDAIINLMSSSLNVINNTIKENAGDDVIENENQKLSQIERDIENELEDIRSVLAKIGSAKICFGEIFKISGTHLLATNDIVVKSRNFMEDLEKKLKDWDAKKNKFVNVQDVAVEIRGNIEQRLSPKMDENANDLFPFCF